MPKRVENIGSRRGSKSALQSIRAFLYSCVDTIKGSLDFSEVGVHLEILQSDSGMESAHGDFASREEFPAQFS